MSAADRPTPASAMTEIYAQREESFAHLASNGIRKSILDAFEAFLMAPGTLSRPSLIVRCQIVNQELAVRVVVDKPISQWRLTEALRPFVDSVLHRTYGCADFFVLVSDNVYVAEPRRPEFVEFMKHVPFFRCDRREDDEVSRHAVLIPDFRIQDVTYGEELIAIDKEAAATPFDDRLDIIKWQGTLSGPDYPNLDNYLDFPRHALVMLSVRHPDILDARLITHDNICDGESGEALRRHLQAVLGPPAEERPAESFVAYKYLVSVDGAVAAWKRVPTILASGSVLLLHHRWNQFFYPGLKPWVHYVPLADDLSDLVERYEWLTARPAEARMIADSGQSFARDVLRPTVLRTYFTEIVNRCGELYGA